jgi:transcriptional regulator NrdR family protein
MEKPEKKRGLVCPKCACENFRVVYTRRALEGRIVRNRECRHCGRRIMTYERVVF